MRPALLSLTVLAGLSACAMPAPAPAQPPAAAEQPRPRPPISGGYQPASGKETGYAEAEKLAIDEIYRREPQRGLVESKTAQVQVVAGLNFSFDIKMTGSNRYAVTVYRDLQGKLAVTSFKKVSD